MSVPLLPDILAFYERDLRETDNPARRLLKQEGLLEEDFLRALGLGYASGALAKTLSKGQHAELQQAGLIYRGRERFRSCLVIPVRDRENRVVDVYGLWLRSKDLRPRFWRSPSEGLLGCERLDGSDRAVLCEYPLHWLRLLREGHLQAVSIRRREELNGAIERLASWGIRQIDYLGRKYRKKAQEWSSQAGIGISYLPVSRTGHALQESVFAELRSTRNATPPQLIRETASHLHFAADELSYRIERGVRVGLSGRVLVRVERDERHILDRVDFSSARSRQGFAGLAGPALGIAATRIEEHLSGMADRLDRKEAQAAEQIPKEEYEESLLAEARTFLGRGDLLAPFSNALEQSLGFVGEEVNRRLAVLVAMSRFLTEPTGALLRGPAGSGKSTLLKAIARLAPASQVMLLSRVTPQSLYFLPEELLSHRLLVVDEYEGMAESEYALRTLMSSQVLSLAITVREGGRLPVTRTINRPARLAIMASTTGAVNPENLSRFLELQLDSSKRQNMRVLSKMGDAVESETEVRLLQAAQTLLAPGAVAVPFASRLMPQDGGDVRIRRRFHHLLSLVKAHAILHQYTREREEGVLQAQAADYEAVRPLVAHWVDHPEEDLSPPAMRLLEYLHRHRHNSFVRQDVMNWLGWSYSMAYRALRELETFELIQGDRRRNGVKRTYALSAYHIPGTGIEHLPDRLAVE